MGIQPQRSLMSTIRHLTFDHLWVVTVLVFVWWLISVLPLPPNDLWWHMAAGRAMVEEGRWIQTNRWAYTLPLDASYVYQSWLSELTLYGLWRLGDVPMLTLARTVAITGSYGLITWHAWRRSGRGKAATLALVLAVLIGWNNWTLRPQTLVLLPGMAFVVVLGEYLDGRVSSRWLLALPLLMVVWVNGHGSFGLGCGLLALAWVGTLIRAIRRGGGGGVPGEDGADDPTARARQQVGPLLLAGGGTLLATMVNPLGVGIVTYVPMMLTQSSLQQWFVEWFPPRNDLDVMNTGFWFFLHLLVLAVLMSAGPRRPSATDLLWYCALAWLTFGGVRYAMWYGLVMLPLLATCLAPLLTSRRPGHPTARTVNPTFAAGYGVGVGILVIAVLPWFQPARYAGIGADHLFASSGPYGMLLSDTTPVAATDWLEQHPVAGRFWADMSYTSYTIWRLPQKQVFADLRVELFPSSVWNDYFTIARGNERSLAMLDQWEITHLMVDRHWQASLYDLLLETPGWCLRFQGQRAAVIGRCS
ncbi:MAG: hypothetical protein HC884_05605 [Chloroflexaceae bacterium]|nr:hypothetical protein [Chloroflexaceae bacterium]